MRPVVGEIGNRIALCKECPNLNKLKMCKICGCFMPAKVRLKGSSCPEGKWGPIIDQTTQVEQLKPPFDKSMFDKSLFDQNILDESLLDEINKINE